jgi:hypothetical protein
VEDLGGMEGGRYIALGPAVRINSINTRYASTHSKHIMDVLVDRDKLGRDRGTYATIRETKEVANSPVVW